MSQVGNFIIIKDGEISISFDQWGALGVLYSIASGPKKATNDALGFDTSHILDGVFAEGGYLIDHDHYNIILFGFHYDDESTEFFSMHTMHSACDEGIESYLHHIAPRWAGWQITYDHNGILAFKNYLDNLGITGIEIILSDYVYDDPPISIKA